MSKIGLCAIAKNENKYLREWVEYYKRLNFDKIILFDNNDLDGETFNEVIQDYIDSSFIKVINVRGKSNQQIECYNNYYQKNEDNLDWIAFFDIDEFLVLHKTKDIHEFLNNELYKNYNCIAINWKLFNDANEVKIKDNNYNVFNRFTESVDHNNNKLVKRIIKTGIKCVINSSHGTVDRSKEKGIYTCYGTDANKNINCCLSNGEKIQNKTMSHKIDFSEAQLNHYRYKTIEEYILNKKARGYATIYQNNGKDMSIKQFFGINRYSNEKIKVIAELLNISIIEAESLSGYTEYKFKEAQKKNSNKKSNYYLYF